MVTNGLAKSQTKAVTHFTFDTRRYLTRGTTVSYFIIIILDFIFVNYLPIRSFSYTLVAIVCHVTQEVTLTLIYLNSIQFEIITCYLPLVFKFKNDRKVGW